MKTGIQNPAACSEFRLSSERRQDGPVCVILPFMESVLGTDLIGHATIRRLLSTWVEHPAPAYLFTGPPHLGKHTFAERFVPLLLGFGSQDPHWKTHPDLVLLEPEEGKTLVSVEQVRAARERLALRPSVSPRVVAYLPFADRLNESGTNALLKVLEEPPAGAVFVLVAEDAGRIPATLKSRSVVVPFTNVPRQEIEEGMLARGLPAVDASRLAMAAHGKPGRALADDAEESSGRRFAQEFLSAKTSGKRLALIDELSKRCDASDDAAAAWRDALQSASETVGERLAEDPLVGSAFGIALLTSLGSVGSAVPPRLALEACAVRLSMDPQLISSFFPTHLPKALPLLYTF
jgi:DNA polymerase-3 subunit delta'